jgi:hypothetical protein
VRNLGKKQADEDEFTQRYRALIAHYGMQPEHTQPASPNENGDVEQSHNRFLLRIDQALMLRGSRDFESRAAYESFLRHHCDRANRHRTERFSEEIKELRSLPARPYDAARRFDVRVGPGSTIRVLNNAYSVPSRLIDERVEAIVRSETIEIVYAQTRIASMPRLRGRSGYCVDYRHVIDWLVKKPGAFDNYIYQAALFPTTRFRMAYDHLIETRPSGGKKEYLRLLQIAARYGQAGVEQALRRLQADGSAIGVKEVLAAIEQDRAVCDVRSVEIAPIDLLAYDVLIDRSSLQSSKEAVHA